MGIEDELLTQFHALPPARRAQVVDFMAYLSRQEAEADPSHLGHGEAVLDAIAADPVARERFSASIEQAMADMDAGAGRSLDDVAARLRERARQRGS